MAIYCIHYVLNDNNTSLYINFTIKQMFWIVQNYNSPILLWIFWRLRKYTPYENLSQIIWLKNRSFFEINF